MSIVQNTLIGAARQKIGNAVFSTWKGIYVLKSKPLTVANPQSDNQVMRRSALSQTVAIFRQVIAVVLFGYKSQAVKKSEYNAFTSEVLKGAFNYATPPTATLIPANVLISKGTIGQTAISSVVADRSLNTVVVTYPIPADQPGQSASDKPLVAVFNSTLNDWYAQAATATRASGSASVSLPSSWATGNSLVVFLGFYNATTGDASDSVNSPATIVA